jgi:hypothetical protein
MKATKGALRLPSAAEVPRSGRSRQSRSQGSRENVERALVACSIPFNYWFWRDGHKLWMTEERSRSMATAQPCSIVSQRNIDFSVDEN